MCKDTACTHAINIHIHVYVSDSLADLSKQGTLNLVLAAFFKAIVFQCIFLRLRRKKFVDSMDRHQGRHGNRFEEVAPDYSNLHQV